jgi:hypothetical protein
MAALRYSLTIDGPLAVADYASVTYTEVVSGVIIPANPSVAVALAQGGVTTIDVVYLKPSIAMTFFFNASATAVPVDAGKELFMSGTAITAITYSTAADGTLTYLLAGA